jgi:hypothetical protein
LNGDECAECIRAELAQAKARLAELEPLVGSPACKKYLETLQSFDDMKAELAQAKAENAAMCALLCLPEDYCLCCGGKGGHHEGCKGTSGLEAMASMLAKIGSKLEQTKSENARLASALIHVNEYWNGSQSEEAMYHALNHIREFSSSASGGGLVLRDLLAPTIELLLNLRPSYVGLGGELVLVLIEGELILVAIDRELARLRALTERKE